MKKVDDELLIKYYNYNEVFEIDSRTDYIIARTSPENVERIIQLEKAGFSFHNRTILCEINLDRLNPDLVKLLRGDVRKKTAVLPDEIYDVASKAFTTDRRFHLEKRFNQSLANRVLGKFISEQLNLAKVVFTCYHKERIIGFTIIKDLGEGRCENVLGAVDPEYQNKGAAFNLYVSMAKSLQEDGYKTLYGRISTTNTASINLHIMLGGKYSQVEDEYIFRNKR